MPPTPVIPIPPGQRIAYSFPTQAAAGPIQVGGGNGGASATLIGGSVAQSSSSPLGNPGFSAIWFGFKNPCPPGAVITHIFPLFQNLEVACPDVVPFGQYGSTAVGSLGISVLGLGGSNFDFANPSNGQATIPGPGSGIGTTWDNNFQIGIQVLQTNSSGPYGDFVTALRPCFQVYYSGGGEGNMTSVPTGSLISSGPSVPDNCVNESRSERKIGTLIIDWTQVPILGGMAASGSENFSYPEFTYVGDDAASTGFSIPGYQVVELDLATAWGGLGLDEVRSVIATHRPTWSVNDDGGELFGPSDVSAQNIIAASVLLTATKTQQTVRLGGPAALNVAGGGNISAAQDQAFPFFVVGKPLTIRILNLVLNWDAILGAPFAIGKTQLQFCNFDVRPYDSGTSIFTQPTTP